MNDNKINISRFLILLAVICFAFAAFSVGVFPVEWHWLAFGFWVASKLV
jgi:hypothetical protein